MHNHRHLPSPRHLMLNEFTFLEEEELKSWRQSVGGRVPGMNEEELLARRMAGRGRRRE